MRKKITKIEKDLKALNKWLVGDKKKAKKKAEEKNIRNVSLPKGISIDSIDLKRANFLCSLPKILGQHPDTGKDITLNSGRFGPYLKCENKSARIENIEEIWPDYPTKDDFFFNEDEY